jgi:hypothetical protein
MSFGHLLVTSRASHARSGQAAASAQPEQVHHRIIYCNINSTSWNYWGEVLVVGLRRLAMPQQAGWRVGMRSRIDRISN